MSEQNKTVSRRAVEEMLVGGNLDLAAELFDESYVGHDVTSPEPVRGIEGVKALVQGYRAAFPDLQLTIEDQVAEGDRVATRWRATMTHRGSLVGESPTGDRVVITGITIERFEDGMIVESWRSMDTLGLLASIGALPQRA